MTASASQCPACYRLLEPGALTCPRCETPCRPASSPEFRPEPYSTLTSRFAELEGDSPDHWEVGTLIRGRYQLTGLLGAGGMGTVYRATDLAESRHVALKVLDAELLAHRTATERMQLEAEALTRVHHANVVHLYQSFQSGGRMVLVLELVAGGTLTQLMGGSGLPAAEVLYLLQGILLGLQAIHEAGLVHRDIKPDNILLSAAGVPKLADLGVARDLHRDPSRNRTQVGARIGTPYYMSPEQAQGLEVGVRSDIFSVGVLAYEMLTGRKAFNAASEIEVLAAIVRDPPQLDLLFACTPHAMADVIAQAMAKDPEHRFASSRAMRRALGLD